MNFEWMSFVELGIIALALVIGTFFRAKIGFFQKFMIPNSITAGILLLLFYSLLAPKLRMNTKFLENLVYHLVNISFVAMALRKPEKRNHEKRPAFATAMNILSIYVIQGVLGLVLTFVFIKTFIPNLFPSFGFFIPLGFALGPGQAFAIGQKWEAPAYGFEGSGSVGLTFAAVGFFWAIFGGVFLINLAIRKGWIKNPNGESGDGGNRSGLLRHDDKFPIGAHLTTQSSAIETFAFNISIIFIVYLAAYLFLKLLTFALTLAGPMGLSLAESFWGISFIFATLFGLIGRKIIDLFKVGHILENGTLTRTTGLSVDFMVAASIGAISVKFVVVYWVPILIMCIVAGVITLIVMLWMSSRVYTDHKFERMILIYGCLTGTLPSGLTLLRVVDPEFTSPASSDYIPAAGIMFIFAIPYVLMVDFPAYAYRDNNPFFYWLTAGIFAAYIIFTAIGVGVVMKRNKSPFGGPLWKK